MDRQRVGALIRLVRRRRDAADRSRGRGRIVGLHGVNGGAGTLGAAVIRGALRDRGGARHPTRGHRLLARRRRRAAAHAAHSHLAGGVAAMLKASGWQVEPEVSFSVYGERGVIDQIALHASAAHMLVLELKTEIVDVNELLGTFDRKLRLARTIARAWLEGRDGQRLARRGRHEHEPSAGGTTPGTAASTVCRGRPILPKARRSPGGGHDRDRLLVGSQWRWGYPGW
jgi:hypothetical protein